jgi:hypothetical protein
VSQVTKIAISVLGINEVFTKVLPKTKTAQRIDEFVLDISNCELNHDELMSKLEEVYGTQQYQFSRRISDFSYLTDNTIIFIVKTNFRNN